MRRRVPREQQLVAGQSLLSYSAGVSKVAEASKVPSRGGVATLKGPRLGAKGNLVKIPGLQLGQANSCAATQQNLETLAVALEGVFFSF